jgi:hypothetical protein
MRRGPHENRIVSNKLVDSSYVDIYHRNISKKRMASLSYANI